jgi:adenosylcobinamide-GDP ribazoletransferase
MKSFFAAIKFLTILPVPGFLCGTERHFTASRVFFPAAGFLIGLLCLVLTWFVFDPFVPKPLIPVLIVLALALLSGGLHLDGLADTADGFFSHKDADKVLLIMKDSRIGTMGVLALVFVLLIKCVSLFILRPQWVAGILILAPTIGRSSFLVQLFALEPARPGKGMGRLFKPGISWFHLGLGLVIPVAAGWFALGLPGLVIACMCLVFQALFCLACYGKIRGFTGDTLGALSELAETLAFFACACLGRS